MLLLSAVVLTVGLAVAYYNTASLGYDNANILTYSNEFVRLFDITINFQEVIDFFKALVDIFKLEPIAV